MAVIELDERTAAALRAQAGVRDLSLGAFLQRIAESSAPLISTPGLALAEMEQSIDEVATASPVLPASFSRADLYAEHD